MEMCIRDSDGAEEGAVVGSNIFHVIQHAVIPQVTGNVVQDELIDLALRIGGVVADIGSI